MTVPEASPALLAVLLALFPALCYPDEVASQGQAILEKRRQAVVTVKLL